jgi:hypothetical protein
MQRGCKWPLRGLAAALARVSAGRARPPGGGRPSFGATFRDSVIVRWHGY